MNKVASKSFSTLNEFGSGFLLQRFTLTTQQALFALILCFFRIDIHAEETCGTPILISPARVDLGDVKPRFEWTPVENAKHYRLWLESRLPEGRFLSTYDILTPTTNWSPPIALTESRALVKLKLLAVCDMTAQTSAATPVNPLIASFKIDTNFKADTNVSCVLSDPPIVTLVEQQAEVSWPAVAAADFYELSVFFGEKNKLARKTENLTEKFQLEPLSVGVWAFAVRPHCPSGYGAYRFKVLNR